MPDSSDPFAVAPAFLAFAEKECPGQSPLYGALARAVAADPDMLRLSDEVRVGQPRPNMLFAAVHALLLRDPAGGDPTARELAAFYPDLSASPEDPQRAFASFKAFCAQHRADIVALLRRRVVSTNEALRAACLRPAYALAEQSLGRFHLIEIGASAGLTLIWDRYAYDDGRAAPDTPATPRLDLDCELRGRGRLPHAPSPPLSRCGVDPEPLRVGDPEDKLWLRALVWPEQRARARRLALALKIAAADPPRILRGTANACLPGLLRALPARAPVCISHAFTLNQFSPGAREDLDALLRLSGETRPLARVGLEWGAGTSPELHLTLYADGRAEKRHLAHCDAHGAWIRWAAQ